MSLNSGDYAARSYPITPSDDNLIEPPVSSLWVGNAGSISGYLVDDSLDDPPTLWNNIPAGTLLPFWFKKIMLTNTSAQSLVGHR